MRVAKGGDRGQRVMFTHPAQKSPFDTWPLRLIMPSQVQEQTHQPDGIKLWSVEHTIHSQCIGKTMICGGKGRDFQPFISVSSVELPILTTFPLQSPISPSLLITAVNCSIWDVMRYRISVGHKLIFVVLVSLAIYLAQWKQLSQTVGFFRSAPPPSSRWLMFVITRDCPHPTRRWRARGSRDSSWYSNKFVGNRLSNRVWVYYCYGCGIGLLQLASKQLNHNPYTLSHETDISRAIAVFSVPLLGQNRQTRCRVIFRDWVEQLILKVGCH